MADDPDPTPTGGSVASPSGPSGRPTAGTDPGDTTAEISDTLPSLEADPVWADARGAPPARPAPPPPMRPGNPAAAGSTATGSTVPGPTATGSTVPGPTATGSTVPGPTATGSPTGAATPPVTAAPATPPPAAATAAATPAPSATPPAATPPAAAARPVTPPARPVTPPRVTPPTAPASAAPARPQADWAVEVADRIDGVVAKVRANTSDRLVGIARIVVYGLLAVVMGVMAGVLLVIFAIRLLDVAIPGEVWIPYLLLGAIFLGAGMLLWSKRSAKPARD